MEKNIKEIILESKSRSDACLKIFGYNNKSTLEIVDKYISEMNHIFVKNIKYCTFCGKEITNSKNEKFCSSSCSASYNNKNRKCSDETKEKISAKIKMLNPKKIVGKICIYCNKNFNTTNRYKKTCSDECLSEFRKMHTQKIGIIGGKKSVLSQNRRSKNENLFGELCQSLFDNVILNEPIFNGWDADIIIEDYKLAILWNGVWHYKQIGKNHSLLQVQNRDNIKIKEIKNCGYIPYIIKDDGKFNTIFVKTEFEKLLEYINKIKNE